MHKDISELHEKIEMMINSHRKIEAKMDEIMEGLKGLLMERHLESDNVSHEIHEDDTEKVNHEWRNFGFGLQMNHIPKKSREKLKSSLYAS